MKTSFMADFAHLVDFVCLVYLVCFVYLVIEFIPVCWVNLGCGGT